MELRRWTDARGSDPGWRYCEVLVTSKVPYEVSLEQGELLGAVLHTTPAEQVLDREGLGLLVGELLVSGEMLGNSPTQTAATFLLLGGPLQRRSRHADHDRGGFAEGIRVLA